MSIETVEPLELALVTLAAATVILTLFNLRSALLDRQAARIARVNGPVSMWANAAIWGEVMRGGKATALLLIGAILVTLPSPAATAPPMVSWLVEMVEMSMVGLAALLLLASIHGAETRRLLREYLEPPKWDGVERRIRQLPPSPPKPPTEAH